MKNFPILTLEKMTYKAVQYTTSFLFVVSSEEISDVWHQMSSLWKSVKISGSVPAILTVDCLKIIHDQTRYFQMNQFQNQ